MLQAQRKVGSAPRAIGVAEPCCLLLQDGTDYAVFVVDRKGHVVEWGASAERLFGYKRDDILGAHFCRLFLRPEEVRRGEPENELRTADFIGCACADRWYVRKDGTALSCLGVTAPLQEPGGDHHFYVKVLRDFTRKPRPKEHSAGAYACADHFGTLLAIINETGAPRFGNRGAALRDVAAGTPGPPPAPQGRHFWN
jgi:PAS domain S-box-containing protein